MSTAEKSPGRAAYEARAARMGGRRDTWDELPATYRDIEEAGAQAAIGWWHAERDLEPPREITVSPSELAAARMVVAEMISHWQRTGTTREEDELIQQWRERAGIERTS